MMKVYRGKLIGASLSAILLCWPVEPVNGMQPASGETAPDSVREGQNPSASAVMAEGGKKVRPVSLPIAGAAENPAADNADRMPITTAHTIKTDKITSFFVRANDSKRIQLSMIIASKEELTQAVRALLGEKVTPLLFSVSTLPNRTVYFDPSLLRFEQRGRIWQPSKTSAQVEILTLEKGGQFGGTLTDGQVHQGVIFLPPWFDPQAPITLRYGDFHYLARFID
jgi:hypothetical protein